MDWSNLDLSVIDAGCVQWTKLKTNWRSTPEFKIVKVCTKLFFIIWLCLTLSESISGLHKVKKFVLQSVQPRTKSISLWSSRLRLRFYICGLTKLEQHQDPCSVSSWLQSWIRPCNFVCFFDVFVLFQFSLYLFAETHRMLKVDGCSSGLVVIYAG